MQPCESRTREVFLAEALDPSTVTLTVLCFANLLLLTGLLGLLVSGLAGCPLGWEVLAHLPKSFFPGPLGHSSIQLKHAQK